MQAISRSYKGLNLIVDLVADRLLVPLAIGMSLLLATGIIYRILNAEVPLSPTFF
ncbi:hypothetical protein OU426_00845 [Frigidibacter sp. RF13]|uniref:hypothetical protein n=1 Tax=Frigidibacter sp. RF13 TaxID=2997340 RepID=UPI002271C65F|nr:hypothetical protein [Frigidibacter sp. RF13]MCY1125389.1 hypothetical protein [Frigidibacter sp. RF13]